MTVGGLALDPMTKTPIVLLKDDAKKITVPIWIGALEATALATQLEGITLARPMTHDLLRKLVEQAGAKINRVEITELRDSTFYASIWLDVNGQLECVDARPSDALSLALRADCPIFVAQAVIDTLAASQPSAADFDEEDEQGEGSSESNDLSTTSPDQWDEILDGLDPSDFKYRM